MSMRVILAGVVMAGGLPTVGAAQVAEAPENFFGICAAPLFDDGVPPLHEPEAIPFTGKGRRVAEACVPGS